MMKSAIQGALKQFGYELNRYDPYDNNGISTLKIVSWTEGERRVSFAVMDEVDHIQREHLQRKFYEPEELRIVADHFPRGGTFFDAGANVGNHSMYAAACLGASQVIAVEPNPDAYRLLLINAVLNGCQTVVEHHAVGLSSRSGGHAVIEAPRRNLGGARLKEESDGPLELVAGDDIVGERSVDFVKIDVEGMEMNVLAGLSETIRRCRPPIFIEVDNANDAEFKAYVDQNDLTIVTTHKRYEDNCNYLIAARR